MTTRRLTMAQALVEFLANQYSERDGREQRLLAGCFGISEETTTGVHRLVQMAERGERMPVCIVVGADPASVYSASAPLPPTVDEFIFAGFLRRAFHAVEDRRGIRQSGQHIVERRDLGELAVGQVHRIDGQEADIDRRFAVGPHSSQGLAQAGAPFAEAPGELESELDAREVEPTLLDEVLHLPEAFDVPVGIEPQVPRGS